VHGSCGLWGVIAVGIFDNEKGLISDSHDSFSYLGWQLVGAVCILIWVLVITVPFFIILNKLKLLRVPLIDEVIGLDVAEMGSVAVVDNLVAAAINRAHESEVKSEKYE